MEWKNVNIFISSTFNDMHAERDYLVKYVFPELSEWCDRRKLRLNDIDLRWGVTAEDARTSRTIGICLRNIDESRPFFICFLGQRRGWKPEITDLDESTVTEYPDVTGLIGSHTVTEMEIEHALIDPLRKMANGKEIYPGSDERSLIFLRDPSYIKNLSDSQKKIFTNAAEEDPDASDRELENFRNALRERFPQTLDYGCRFDVSLSSPELGGSDTEEGKGRLTGFSSEGVELREVILTKLREAILKEFPDRTDEVPVMTDSDRRELFAENTAEGYIERGEDLGAVESYISGDSKGCLILSAESGSGKSMLLARTYLDLKKKGVKTIYRSAGTSEDTSDVLGLFSGILSEAGSAPPLDTEDLTENIGKFLTVLSAMRSVLIIDALDQIPLGTDVLRWFPSVMPEGLKVIFSVRSPMLTDDISPEALEKRGHIVYELKPFDAEGKRLLIEDYLSSHFKKLDEDETEMLLKKKGSSNPLFLKAAVSELRVLGKFEQLRDRIESLGTTPSDVFTSILERMENDHITDDMDSSETVPRLFSLLSCSRYGLSYRELDSIFSELEPDRDVSEIDPVIKVYIRQLRSFLMQFEGITDMRYSELRRAASVRYADLSESSHKLIADCFLKDLGEDLSSGSRRSLSEIVYHYTMAGRHEAAELLESYRFIKSKTKVCGISALISDYEFLLSGDRDWLEIVDLLVLNDVLEALRKSAYVISERPEELASQLMMRLSRAASKKVTAQIKKLEDSPFIACTDKVYTDMTMTVLDNDAEGTVYLKLIPEGILTVNGDGSVRIISDRDGRVIRTVRSGGERINCACLDGNALYIAGKDFISYYDVYTCGKLGGTQVKDEIFSVTVCDGSVIAGGIGKVYAFDRALASSKTIGKHRGAVRCLASGKGRVWSAGDDGRITAYDKQSLKKHCSKDLHFGKLTVLKFFDGMLLAGGFGETLHKIDPLSLKVIKSTYTMTDAFTSDILVSDGKICRFSGRSLRISDSNLVKLSDQEGTVRSVIMADVSDGRACFITANGQIGIMPEKDLTDGASAGSGPAHIIAYNDDTVLIADENGGLHLYDREEERYVPIGEASREDITSAAACEDGFLLGRRSGQVMFIYNFGMEETVVNYAQSINLDPDIPVTCITTDGYHIAYRRYGEIVTACFADSDEDSSLRVVKGFSDADSMLIHEGKLYISEQKTVHVKDVETHEDCGSFDIPDRCAKMIPLNGSIYLAMLGGLVYSYEPYGGKLSFILQDRFMTDFAVSDSITAVSGYDRAVRIYRNGRLITKLTLDDVPEALAMDGERLFIGMYGGDLICADLINRDAFCDIPYTVEDLNAKSVSEDTASEGKGKGTFITSIASCAAACAAAVTAALRFGGTLSGLMKPSTMILASLVLMIPWFLMRTLDAAISKEYKRASRILPSVLMMTGSALIFLAVSLIQINAPAETLLKFCKTYTSLLAVGYPYVVAELLDIVTRGRMRLNNGVDAWMERYADASCFIILAVTLIKAIKLF